MPADEAPSPQSKASSAEAREWFLSAVALVVFVGSVVFAWWGRSVSHAPDPTHYAVTIFGQRIHRGLVGMESAIAGGMGLLGSIGIFLFARSRRGEGHETNGAGERQPPLFAMALGAYVGSGALASWGMYFVFYRPSDHPRGIGLDDLVALGAILAGGIGVLGSIGLFLFAFLSRRGERR
jgi:hypothetical protein